jgi:hypothetical protein
MKKFKPFLIFIILNTGYVFGNSFTRAAKHGHIGETGTLHNAEEGYFIHPFYNDFFGGTDRHLTNMAYVGGLWSVNSTSSLELTGNWRFITPDTKKAIPEDEPLHRDGVFSDWISIDSAYRQTIGERFFLQFDAGYGNIGNHGAKSIQSSFHKSINNVYNNLYYDAPVEGETISYGSQVGHLGRFFNSDYQVAFGSHTNPFMTEAFVDSSISANLAKDKAATFNFRQIRQLSSRIYEDFGLRTYRREFALGLKFNKSWIPSLKIVSPFIERDKGWQVYLDVISWNIPDGN